MKINNLRVVKITHGHYKYLIGSKYTLGELLENEILINAIITFFRTELFIKLNYMDVNNFINRLKSFDSYLEGSEFEYTELLPRDLMSELLDNTFWHFYIGVIDINFFSYDFHLGFETQIEIFDENLYLFIG